MPERLEGMAGGQGWSPAAGVSTVAISARAARGSGVVRPATRSRPWWSGRPRMRASGCSSDPITPPTMASAVSLARIFTQVLRWPGRGGRGVGDHALDAGAGVVEHPGPGHGEVGGHRYQHEPVRELPGEEVLEHGPARGVGLDAYVRACEGEYVEHESARVPGFWPARAREPLGRRHSMALFCDEFLPGQCVPTTTAGSAELDQLSWLTSCCRSCMTVRPSRPIRSPACMKPARNATAIDTVFARTARITAVSMWASVLIRCRCPSGGGLQRHLGQHGTL